MSAGLPHFRVGIPIANSQLARCLYPMIKKLFTTRLGQNILANYFATLWLGLLALALIPVYLKKLGQDQWGIVAICMSIQAFLGLLDAGLGQIMLRDMAQAMGDKREEAKRLLIFSRLYLMLAVAGFALGQIGANWIANSWVITSEINTKEIEAALRLVLVQFLFQFANNAHIGYWNGLEQQRKANLRQCAFATVKHLLAVALVFTWRQDAIAYLIPFALISAIEWIFNRISVMSSISSEARNQRIAKSDIFFFARQSFGLAVAVLTGMLLSQLDRIILSRTVTIADYGIYVIVANLGLAFLQLQAPLARAFFPRIAHATVNKISIGRGTNFAMIASMLVICVGPCLFTAIFAPQVLGLWTGNLDVVEKGAAALSLITIAVAINTFYSIIYMKIIASNATRFLLHLNAMILIGYFVLLPTLANIYGITAGGFGWVFYTSCQLIAGTAYLLTTTTSRIRNGGGANLQKNASDDGQHSI